MFQLQRGWRCTVRLTGGLHENLKYVKHCLYVQFITKLGRLFGKLTIIILRVVHFLFLFISAFCTEELVFLAFFSTAVDNGLFERFPPGKKKTEECY